MIRVVAALIKKDEKYLIAKRSTGNPDLINKWEFPGGKVEDNEDEIHAIEREINEEFELRVRAIQFIASNVFKYPTITIDLRLYECKYLDGEFKLHDHSEIAWVELEEILTYDLAPADIPLIEAVRNGIDG